MIQTFLSYLALYGVYDNVFINYSGAVELQREKRYLAFRYLSVLFLLIGVALTASISYVLYRFVYSKFNLFYIGTTVNVLIVCLYNLLISSIWKKNKRFNRYVYGNSISFAFDIVFTLSIIFVMNFNVGFAEFFIALAAILVVIFISNILLCFFVRSLDRGYMNVSFRNIPARFLFLAIISILLYYAGILIG